VTGYGEGGKLKLEGAERRFLEKMGIKNQKWRIRRGGNEGRRGDLEKKESHFGGPKQTSQGEKHRKTAKTSHGGETEGPSLLMMFVEDENFHNDAWN